MFKTKLEEIQKANRKKPLKIRIKKRMWQILTISTMLFSIASLILWNSTIENSKYQEEFLFIDTAKSELYNWHQKIKNLPKQPTKFSETVKADNYYANVLNIKPDTDNYNLQFAKINSIDNKNRELNDEYNKQILLLKDESNLGTVFKSFDHYVVETRIFYEKLMIFTEVSLDIKKDIYKILNTDINKIDEQLKTLKEKIKNTKNLPIIDDANLAHLEKVEKLIEQIEYIKDNSNQQQKPEFQTKLKETKILFEELIKVELDYEKSLEPLKIAENNLTTELKKLETWQKKYLSKHEELKATTVFIDRL